MNKSYKSSILGYLLITILAFSPLVTVAETLEDAPVSDPVVEVAEEVQTEPEIPAVDETTPESPEEEVVDDIDEVAEEVKEEIQNENQENKEEQTEADTANNDETKDETPQEDLFDNFVKTINENVKAPIVDTFKEETSKQENIVTFVEKVELNVTYKFSYNEQVQVTFTKLPENPGSLSIEEVVLTNEQVKEFGALSNVAYDITSNMENGSFEYDLKLPVPEGVEKVSKVIYAENESELSKKNIGVVDEVKVDEVSNETVLVSEMNHFTIFIVTRDIQDFADLDWEGDRTAPTDGWVETTNTLIMSIDGSKQSTSDHHKTEGVQADIPTGKNSVKVQLLIDSDWSTVDYVRAGLWGKVARVINPANNDTAWPIIEFTNENNNPRFRVWDTISGGWTNLPEPVAYGDTVDFEVLQNPFTSEFEFYLNDNLVHSYSSVDGADNYNFYDGLILNAYNNGESYSVKWSNLELGVVKEVAETSDSKYSYLERYVAANNFGPGSSNANIFAQVLVPLTATKVRATIDGTTITSTDGVDTKLDDNIFKSGIQHGKQVWRIKKAMPVGEYDVFVEYELSGDWYPVTGGPAKAFVTSSLGVDIINPNDSKFIFRPGDSSVVRLRISDKYKSFRDAKFTINGTVFEVTRDTLGVDLRQEGNYVLVDISKASNWVPLPEGSYTAEVNVWNKANQRSFKSDEQTREFIIDATSPQVSEFTAPELVSKTLPVSVKATDNNGIESVKFYLAEKKNGVCKNNYSSIKDVVVTSGVNDVYTAEIDTSALNGEYCVLASAKDVASHTSVPLFKSVEIDNTAPVAEITFPTNNQVVSGVVEIRGTVLDDNLLRYYYNIAGISKTITGDNSFSDQVIYTWDTTTITDGTYSLRLEARDKADNKNSSSVDVINVIVDNTAPAIPTGLFWEDSEGGVVDDNGSTELDKGIARWANNTESDLSHYVYKYWNDINTSPYNDEASAYVASNIKNSSLSGTFNQGYGTHHFCVSAVDVIGNESGCSDVFTINYVEEAIVSTPTPVTPQPEDSDFQTTSSDESRRSSSRRTLGGTSSAGEVLGASTGLNHSCNGMYLNTYLKEGVTSTDVALLQTFLNSEGASLPVTSYFGALTKAAVVAFQNKYAEEILKPWGVSATGFVFKTTRWKINNIVCPGSEEFPMIP